MEYGDGPDFSGEAVLDTVGKEVGSVFRSFLGVATLAALKMRERGQRDAEATAKVTEQKLKEAREEQIRAARHAKATDPRNLELIQGIGVPVPVSEEVKVPRLSNGIALYRTPEQLAQRALDRAMTPIPRTQNPGLEAMEAMTHRTQEQQKAQNLAQELARQQQVQQLNVQHRGPEPPIR